MNAPRNNNSNLPLEVVPRYILNDIGSSYRRLYNFHLKETIQSVSYQKREASFTLVIQMTNGTRLSFEGVYIPSLSPERERGVESPYTSIQNVQQREAHGRALLDTLTSIADLQEGQSDNIEWAFQMVNQLLDDFNGYAEAIRRIRRGAPPRAAAAAPAPVRNMEGGRGRSKPSRKTRKHRKLTQKRPRYTKN